MLLTIPKAPANKCELKFASHNDKDKKRVEKTNIAVVVFEQTAVFVLIFVFLVVAIFIVLAGVFAFVITTGLFIVVCLKMFDTKVCC
jgi:uncharacterized membrane protein